MCATKSVPVITSPCLFLFVYLNLFALILVYKKSSMTYSILLLFSIFVALLFSTITKNLLKYFYTSCSSNVNCKENQSVL